MPPCAHCGQEVAPTSVSCPNCGQITHPEVLQQAAKVMKYGALEQLFGSVGCLCFAILGVVFITVPACILLFGLAGC